MKAKQLRNSYLLLLAFLLGLSGNFASPFFPSFSFLPTFSGELYAGSLSEQELLFQVEAAQEVEDYQALAKLAAKLNQSSAIDAKANAQLLYYEIYLAQNKPAKAIRAAKRAQRLAKRVFKKSPNLWFEATQSIVDYYLEGDKAPSLGKALPYLKELHGKARKIYGLLYFQTYSSGLALAQTQKKIGDLKSANRLLEWLELQLQANKANEELYSLYPEVLAQRAEVLERLGEFKIAIQKSQELYQLQLIAGELIPSLLTLTQIGNLQRQSGDLQFAEVTLQKARLGIGSQITEKEAAEEETSEAMNRVELALAELYEAQGEYDQAEEKYLAVLLYDQTTYGAKDLGTLIDLNNLAGIYRKLGDYQNAEEYYLKSLQGLVETAGKNNLETLSIQNNLALLYENRGFYDKAEPLILEVYAEFSRQLGRSHPKTLAALNNLAMVYESQGRFAKAKKLYLRVQRRAKKAYGPIDTKVIVAENNLAYLYVMIGKYNKAAQSLGKVVTLWEKALGKDHQNTLKAKNSLGRAWMGLKKYAKAKQILNLTLQARTKIFGENHPDSIRSLIDLGRLDYLKGDFAEAQIKAKKSLSLSLATLGQLHPYSFDALQLLAEAQGAEEKLEAAKESYYLLFQRRNHFFDYALWATSEQTRAAYIARAKPEQDQFLNLLARLTTPDAAKLALEVSLKRKGLLLKVSSKIKKVLSLQKDPKLMQIARALHKARKELGRLALRGPLKVKLAAYQEKMLRLAQRTEKLEAKLARSSKSFAKKLKERTVEQVLHSLPKGQALVDFQEYEGEEGGVQKTEVLSVVAHWVKKRCYLVGSCAELEIQLAPLGPADVIQEAIVYLRLAIQEEDLDEDDLVYTGDEVYTHLWQPIEELLHDVKEVYLVPDGSLHLLPFDVVPTAKKLPLGVAYDLKLLSNIKDLVDEGSPVKKGYFMILAGPDYDDQDEEQKVGKKEEQGVKQGVKKIGSRTAQSINTMNAKSASPNQEAMQKGSSQLRGLSFEPLYGAKEEGVIIQKLADALQEKSQIYFGSEAEEKQLRGRKTSPLVLHIATHGFFLAEVKEVKTSLQGAALIILDQKEPKPSGNPLLRSGLAFAGININAPFLGDLPSENDGLLTAFEVLDLDFQNTNLIVLSACETAVGEIHAGEGVYGLRRSFQESGARSVISSLWPVNDVATQILMGEFYKQLLSGLSPRQSLRQAQKFLRESEDWAHPYYWSAFVLVGKR